MASEQALLHRGWRRRVTSFLEENRARDQGDEDEEGEGGFGLAATSPGGGGSGFGLGLGMPGSAVRAHPSLGSGVAYAAEAGTCSFFGPYHAGEVCGNDINGGGWMQMESMDQWVDADRSDEICLF